MLDRMEAANLIYRDRGDKDRRFLTEEAKGLKQKYNEVTEEISTIYYKGFFEEEIAQLENYLHRVLKNMEKALWNVQSGVEDTEKMVQVEMNGLLIGEVETKNIMTKSSLPVGGYSVNPYVGCTHACKYCYAFFMKWFTEHTEKWGTFLDVKHWSEINNPKKYAGQRIAIGSVTDGYNPQEE